MEEQIAIENNKQKSTSKLTITFIVLTVVFAITSIIFLCLWVGNSDSPRIEVSEDGYWIINGEKTNILANTEEKFDDGRLEYTLVETEGRETYKITGVIDKTITEISIPKTSLAYFNSCIKPPLSWNCPYSFSAQSPPKSKRKPSMPSS